MNFRRKYTSILKGKLFATTVGDTFREERVSCLKKELHLVTCAAGFAAVAVILQ